MQSRSLLRLMQTSKEVEMLSSKKLEMLNPFIVFELAVETYQLVTTIGLCCWDWGTQFRQWVGCDQPCNCNKDQAQLSPREHYYARSTLMSQAGHQEQGNPARPCAYRDLTAKNIGLFMSFFPFQSRKKWKICATSYNKMQYTVK